MNRHSTGTGEPDLSTRVVRDDADVDAIAPGTLEVGLTRRRLEA